MWYGFLADVVVALHVAIIGYVVVGQAAIILAAPFRARWARNPWFRFTHLGVIAFVVYEQFNDIRCPLSVWEEKLRGLAGMPFDSSVTFLGRFSRDILYMDLPQTDTFFTAIYVSMFVVVIQGLVMYPPRFFRFRGPTPATLPTTTPATNPTPAAVPNSDPVTAA